MPDFASRKFSRAQLPPLSPILIEKRPIIVDKINVWTKLHGGHKVQLRIDPNQDVESFLVLAQILGISPVGIKLDRFHLCIEENVVHTSQCLEKSLKDLGLHDGDTLNLEVEIDMATINDRIGHLDKKSLKLLSAHMRDTFEQPDDNCKLYSLAAEIEAKLQKETDSFWDLMVQSGHIRLAFALKAKDEAWFKEELLTAHQRAYDELTFTHVLHPSSPSRRLQLTVFTPNKVFPVSVKDTQTLEYLFCLCQVLDPQLSGAFLDKMQCKTSNQIFAGDESLTKTLKDCSIGDTLGELLVISIGPHGEKISSYDIDEPDFECPPYKQRPQGYKVGSGKLFHLMPQLLAEISDQKSIRWYIEKEHPALGTALEEDSTEKAIRAVYSTCMKNFLQEFWKAGDLGFQGLNVV